MASQDMGYILKSLADNAYKNTVPVNLRLLAKQFINPTTVTEANFNQRELDALRDAVYNMNHTGNKKNIQYDDYPRTTQGGGLQENPLSLIAKSFIDPGLATSYAVGRVNRIYKSPLGNTHLADTYNFKPASEFPEEAPSWSNIIRQAHNISAKYGTPMNMDINLGNKYVK